MRRASRWALFLALLPGAASALGPVVLDDQRGAYRLGKHLELLEDPGGRLTVEEVSSPERTRSFGPSPGEVPNLGLTRSVYWARVDLRNQSPADDWLLEVAWPVVDRVAVYLPQAGGGFVEKQAGDRLPFTSWEVPYRNPTFRLPLRPGVDETVYLRIEGEDTMLLPVTVWSARAFDQKRRVEAFSYGFYYGVIAILIAHNLALLFTLWDRNYLYYVLLIAAWGLYDASLSGYATQYLWPDSPALAPWSIHVAAILAFTLSAVFARSFLMTRSYAPVLDRLLLGFVVVGFAFLVWPWFAGVRWFIPIGSAVGLTGSLLLLVSGYRSWRSGYRPARYYLLTWTVAISALFVWALRGYGFVPSNFVTDRAFELVVLSTAITLSLGLADRFNVLRDDLQVLNRDLERRIGERTADLARKSRQFEIANRHKSEFLANVSHELRTPLNAVIGFSEVLLARMFGELNEKQASYVDDIHDSGRHLLSLINDILDLSKIEAGRMELELSQFDLPAAVGNAITLIRERASRQGIEVRCHLEDGIGEIVADERKVKQVLVNLLANAVKCTPEGGSIEVRASRNDSSLEIDVRDTGIGIPPEDQGTIFEEFRQVGGDNGQRVEGTGLGLSLAKRLVELHGGTIRVKSRVGEGATFTISLPVSAWPAS